MFNPRSVAVIGASMDPLKPGYVILRNLISGGFKGSVYPVNPKASEIFDLKAYPKLSDIPNDIDLAVIAVAASNVSSALDDCIRKKVAGIVIISAGFRETGQAGAEAEEHMSERAKKSGIRIVGPNSAGILNASANMYATIEGTPAKGSVAFLSQSGAFGGAIFGWAQDLCLGFSKFVSLGNMCDINFSDLLEYLAQDLETKAIAMYVESIADGKRFISIAKGVSLTKPIVVYKVGRTEAGRKAALSHTGSLATSDRIYDGAFRQAKAIRVYDVEELLDYAFVLTHQPLPKGGRVGILTDAGGPGVAAADACILSGLEIPEIPQSIQVKLKQFLPAFASTKNPVDMTFSLDPNTYRNCIDLIASEDTIDGLIITITSHLGVQEELANTIVKSFVTGRKPLLVSWTTSRMADSARGILRRSGVPVYSTPENAARAMACLDTYSRSVRE